MERKHNISFHGAKSLGVLPAVVNFKEGIKWYSANTIVYVIGCHKDFWHSLVCEGYLHTELFS